MKNHFEALSEPSENIEAAYNNFNKSTEEIALSSLPKKDSQKYTLEFPRTSLITQKNIYEAKKCHETIPTTSSMKNISKAQRQLDNAYTTSEAECIQGKIAYISHLHVTKQYAAAWKTIN